MAQINAPKPLTSPEQRAEERQDRFQTSVARSRSFFEENRTLVIGALVGVVALVLAIFAFTAMRSNQTAEAGEALGGILTAYESGDFETALAGTDTNPGLLDIADEYGSRTAAPFFAADALFQLGRYDEAAEYFDMVDLGGLFGASAVAGRAAIHEMEGQHEEAAELYERAARAYEGPATTPGYFLDAGRAFQAAGDLSGAERAYQAILDDFEDTPEATTAAVELASVMAAQSAVGEPTGDVEPAPVVEGGEGAASPAVSAADQEEMQRAIQQALANQ